MQCFKFPLSAFYPEKSESKRNEQALALNQLIPFSANFACSIRIAIIKIR
ncbi:hypothetical protein SynSYN20_02743 [Synechococcus sp. SYN20]|nr:hypothetical protein SynSYN20_02743 [Synechococcus sp. SYN20]